MHVLYPVRVYVTGVLKCPRGRVFSDLNKASVQRVFQNRPPVILIRLKSEATDTVAG